MYQHLSTSSLSRVHINIQAMNTIPIIDISSLGKLSESGGKSSSGGVTQNDHVKNVAKQIADACKTFGFFAVTNHGVDPQIITSAWDASTDFFDMDMSIKKSVPMSDDYPYGYESNEALGTERSASGADATTNNNNGASSALSSDSKETFSIGPVDTSKSSMPSRKFPTNASI